ncbi:peptide chain release factor N(5)-glutamine methyltransferase [Thalassotalea sp. G2M2-11]|uniref:peptide chain release factor N(5)-glutamine methyltransferase n=1 Tax=Thalassotalea sp. G2M2-11 TaxID=2787627 RepID=UPI0019D196E2|nr:peptide chain release factor N(5)-glutamine methyltransferase [Thalassotalea sp. G2M2-11]
MPINIDTIASAINYGSSALAEVSDSAKLDSQILLAHVLAKTTAYLYTWPEQLLSQTEQQDFLSLLAKRQHCVPIAYLIGYKEFWSLNFKVSPATLIPRPDTEVLVELVLEHYAEQQLCCLDLGTGTGAIALALASERNSWQIDAVDFQVQAVELAKENATELSLSQVNIFQSDWFSAVPIGNIYQVIVSNPPYIDPLDQHLTQGDVQFEPKSALVAEQHGLADIHKIISQAKDYLATGGRLYFEHGYDQGPAVRELFAKQAFEHIETVKDYNGNDRITYASFYHKNNKED